MAIGMSIEDVIIRATWNPARSIKREDLGNLSEGAVADIAVLSVQREILVLLMPGAIGSKEIINWKQSLLFVQGKLFGISMVMAAQTMETISF